VCLPHMACLRACAQQHMCLLLSVLVCRCICIVCIECRCSSVHTVHPAKPFPVCSVLLQHQSLFTVFCGIVQHKRGKCCFKLGPSGLCTAILCNPLLPMCML
jgi:hypothetical protein